MRLVCTWCSWLTLQHDCSESLQGLTAAAVLRSGPSVRNYNYYSAPAPPLIGGYGYGGYGGGLTFAPSFGMPLFYGGGGFFNILIFMVRNAASTVLVDIGNLS